ncbi:MAG TPA: AMP-binding protein, partial [Bryobacteraceae bacterium]|nr:AMP-binding protein [Bryobacteraceae bacterium]
FPQFDFESPRPGLPWWKRWWKYRAIHRMFGWKFCCFVSGGAPLPPDLEAFWSELAFVIVQGYGLTETAPIISFSHPFHPRRGTTGKPVNGVEVKLAEDGEVLVRGQNVTPGYYAAPEQTSGAFLDGWLRTGDLGEFDAQGNLVIRGRKKDVIVTPEGLKVFPEDVEAKLNAIPGVRESAVIGHDRVHAVLVLEPDAPGADEIVREANLTLEEHQKIRNVTVWTGGPLPRTKTTLKLRRGEISEAVGHGITRSTAAPESELASLVAKYAPGRTIQGDTSLAELGLSSLDRVGLMMDLEAKLNTSLEETAFASARTVGDLAKAAPAPEKISFPAWNRKLPVRLFRAVSFEFLLPLASLFAWRRVSGRENLRDLQGPVIFAANHQSLLDTPVILASLPRRWRRRVAPAMWLEFFGGRIHPEQHSLWERFQDNSLFFLAALFFNAYPIPQTERSLRDSIRYSGELAEEGWSILIHPEGARSRTDELLPFYPGTAVLASHLRLPVVPLRIRGLNRVLSPDEKWPVPGPVRVAFGAPLTMGQESVADFTRRLEQAMRAL